MNVGSPQERMQRQGKNLRTGKLRIRKIAAPIAEATESRLQMQRLLVMDTSLDSLRCEK